MYHIAVLTKSETQETFYRELMLRATDEEGEAAAHSSQKDRSKAIKCLEVHTVKQTEKQYSFIVRRFLVETAQTVEKGVLTPWPPLRGGSAPSGHRSPSDASAASPVWGGESVSQREPKYVIISHTYRGTLS